MLKPFSFPRFLKAVSKVTQRNAPHTTDEQRNVEPIYIKSGHEYHKVSIEDIILIHSDRDYTEIQLESNKYLSNESLKHWEDFLSDHKFIRIHKSYLINRKKILKIRSSSIEMMHDYAVPIGRAYKDNVNQLVKG